MKPVLVSGIQPTGRLHIGNYLGALKNFVELQNSGKYQCCFPIVDLHSLTASFDPKKKRGQILDLVADYLTAGLDPKESLIFLQSLVPAHAELTWILNTITPFGELRRMTQFKEKAGQLAYQTREETGPAGSEHKQLHVETNVGLFDYPVLMTADIILYDAEFVPIGEDQLQHLELARTLVRKFNSRFGKTFVEPRPLMTKTPRVMSLENPLEKMSKSKRHPMNCVYIDDSPEEIHVKIKRAVTDSGSEIKYDKKHKPAISNLLGIYSALSNKPIPRLEEEFKGKKYSDFKTSLARLITEHFAGFRKKKTALLKKPNVLKSILVKGSRVANKKASRKMDEVRKKVGLAI